MKVAAATTTAGLIALRLVSKNYALQHAAISIFSDPAREELKIRIQSQTESNSTAQVDKVSA